MLRLYRTTASLIMRLRSNLSRLPLAKAVGWFAVVTLFSGCVATGTTKTKVDPRKAIETRLELGAQYLESGSRDAALRQFLEVIEVDKKNAMGHRGLAMVLQLNGESEGAEDSFKKALRHAEDDEISHVSYSYGLFLIRQRRFEDALSQFSLVAKDLGFVKRAAAIYFAGRCALELGNLEKAKASFEHALNLRPNEGGSALELADMAFKERDYANAKGYLDHFNRVSDPSARSLWLGIRIERIFGNKDREASQALALKNLFGYSKEYLDYKRLIGN